jgi:outer membrane protein OmpA-like peptidoglycan-associated protein
VRVWAVDPSGVRVEAEVVVSGDAPMTADGSTIELPIGEHSLVVTAAGFLAEAVSLHVDRGEVREYTAVLRADGQQRVDVGADRLHLADKIYFDKNKATIQPHSYGLLDEVATVLLAHAEIQSIEIGGHTDDRGSANHNQSLSADRAAAVKQYLESKGVSPSRLRSVGYGESHPLTPGSSELAWAKNRRVELRILDRG